MRWGGLQTRPTTQEGKNISRFNRLTHGLRAKIPVLPGECTEAYATRLATWIEDLGASDDAQRFLVERAAGCRWILAQLGILENSVLRFMGL
jgi:hypothetical protein